MKLLSVNVSLPRPVDYQGRTVETGIFKSPVFGRVPVRRLNLDGDGQADLTGHGGVNRAVYAYPYEHYGHWAVELGRDQTPLPGLLHRPPRHPEGHRHAVLGVCRCLAPALVHSWLLFIIGVLTRVIIK